MDSRLSVRQLRGWGGLIGLTLAAVVGGCVQPADVQRDELASARALPLATGTRLVKANTGEQMVYQVSVPAGQSVQVEATSGSGGTVELVYVEAPDGRNFVAAPNNAVASQNGLFDVADMASESGGNGFRLNGSVERSGNWRFALVGTHAAANEAFGKAARQKSLIEQGVLLFYIITGPHRNAEDPLDLIAAMGRLVYAEVDDIYEPIDIRLRVTIDGRVPMEGDSDQDQPGDNSNNDNSSDNSNDNTSDGDNSNDNISGNDNANDNKNENDNDGDNANDNNANDNGNNNGNGNTNDNGGTTPPPPPPTKVNLQRIVASGDPVPGQTAGAKFTRFGNPAIDGDGRIAFWAAYSGGQGDGGLYVWDNGVVRRVVDDNPQTAGSVPGRNASAYFGNFNVMWDAGSHPLAWGSDGRLIFVSPIQGGVNSRGVYRWRASDGDIVRVADMEQVGALFTDTFQGAFACEFFGPGLTDGGLVTFNVRYTYITADRQFVAGKRGVFTSDGTTIRVVADNRLSVAGDVPEQSDAVTFDDFDPRTTLNARGDILLQASYLGGVGSRGIYRSRDGVLSRVIDNANERSFPGLPKGKVGLAATFADAMAIGGNGDIALDTKFRPSGGEQRDAVILWNGQQWRELTDASSAVATALLSGVNDAGETLYLAGDRPHMARDSGDLNLAAVLPTELVFANVAWETSGGALNNAGRALLRFTRTIVAGGAVTPGLMLWTGEKLVVTFDPTTDLTLSAVDVIFAGSTPEQNRPGRNGALNDADEMVFRTGDRGVDGQEGTADDVQVVYVGRGE